MKPVCVDCNVEMVPAKTGIIVEEMIDDKDPYRLWAADLFRCPVCNARVLQNFAKEPYKQHFESDYGTHRWRAEVRFYSRAEHAAKASSR